MWHKTPLRMNLKIGRKIMFHNYRLKSSMFAAILFCALVCALSAFTLSSSTASAATLQTPPRRPAPQQGNRAPAPQPVNQNTCSSTFGNGTQGAPVQVLQRYLNQQGFKGANGRPLPTNGSFDAQTQFAVKQFQLRHHLPPNGVVGPAFWQLLGPCGQR
jgi:peptidoglycan hydrolase-like protein with peptidoglycan-binding domain